MVLEKFQQQKINIKDISVENVGVKRLTYEPLRDTRHEVWEQVSDSVNNLSQLSMLKILNPNIYNSKNLNQLAQIEFEKFVKNVNKSDYSEVMGCRMLFPERFSELGFNQDDFAHMESLSREYLTEDADIDRVLEISEAATVIFPSQKFPLLFSEEKIPKPERNFLRAGWLSRLKIINRGKYQVDDSVIRDTLVILPIFENFTREFLEAASDLYILTHDFTLTENGLTFISEPFLVDKKIPERRKF